MGATVAGITYLTLVVGELVPKQIALAQPERTASLVARPMLGLSFVAAPVVWLLHISTRSVLRVLGLSGARETTITEEEVKSLIAEGTQAGVFVKEEQEMIAGVLRLADRPVRVIMTPRSSIAWIDVKADQKAIVQMVDRNRFSRLPVCDGTVDNPVGVVHTKDLLPEALRCDEVDLSALMAPLPSIPEHTPVLKVLNRLKREKVHIASVVDEYGATEGLVTLTDVMESIAGDFPERGEEAGPRVVKRGDRSWLMDGTLPTDEVKALTGIDMGRKVKMLAGFVMEHLGRIPEAGSSFTHGNARFEVVDMDGNRIDKVLVQVDQDLSGPAGPGGH